MEHGKPIFLHMEVLRAHRDVGRGSLKKREGRAVGHVTCTEKVADWAFSWIKADQLAEFVDRIGRPGTSNENRWPINILDVSCLRPMFILGIEWELRGSTS